MPITMRALVAAHAVASGTLSCALRSKHNSLMIGNFARRHRSAVASQETYVFLLPHQPKWKSFSAPVAPGHHAEEEP